MYTIKYGGIWNISKESKIFPYIWMPFERCPLYRSVWMSVCVCVCVCVPALVHTHGTQAPEPDSLYLLI